MPASYRWLTTVLAVALLASCTSTYDIHRLKPVGTTARGAGRQKTVTPPPQPGPEESVTDQWYALETWVQSASRDTPLKITRRGNPAYELSTRRGPVVLRENTRQSLVDGNLLWLAFAPFESSGNLMVHGMDLRKNLSPLLQPDLTLPRGATIVLDPGHGGSNRGAWSASEELYEKHLTLDWAIRTRALLTQAGYRAILTRTLDVELSLAERVTVAEKAGADLFLSLHFNSAGGARDQSGIETFCLTPVGMPSTITRDFEDDPRRSFPNNQFDEQNLRLALTLHRELLQATGATDRGVRRARFMTVLQGQPCPAVLLEAGYLSNPAEAGKIATEAYRQRLAQAVTDALTSSSPARYRDPLIRQMTSVRRQP